MSYTYDQALTELRNLRTNGNLNETTLRSFITNLDITASGSQTVLYAGTLADGTKTSAIAQQMKNDPNIRILDKTDAARFLDITENTEFNQALFDVFGDRAGDRGTKANEFLFGQTNSSGNRLPNGAWDNISGRFTEATTGEEKKRGQVLC